LLSLDKDKKIDAQCKLCICEVVPLIANFLCCPTCGKDFWNYFSTEQAAKELITGCPYCRISFCE